jgi:hypothetical protein
VIHLLLHPDPDIKTHATHKTHAEGSRELLAPACEQPGKYN